MSNIELNNGKRTAWSEVPWYVIEATGGGYYISNTENGEPGSFIIGPEQGSITVEDATRIVECVNALSGVDYPATFVNQAKQLIPEDKVDFNEQKQYPNRYFQ